MTEKLIGIIGGSGLGDRLGSHITETQVVKIDTPFGPPSDDVLIGKIGLSKIAFINRHGKGHRLSPSDVPYAANIFALKKLGAHAVIGTCAVGSLQEEIAPADLVVVDQFIDKTFRRQNTFFSDYGVVHCEMAHPVCRRLGDGILQAASNVDAKVHPKACYVCIEGPQFSTRAESLMHRGWGGDLVGMTAMPEAKLAREAQICYALIALVSDYDCWRPQEADKDKQTLLKEIIGNLNAATDNCIKLVRAVLDADGELVCEDCHCRKSLDLAVWTDQAQIKPEQKEKLKVLFE